MDRVPRHGGEGKGGGAVRALAWLIVCLASAAPAPGSEGKGRSPAVPGRVRARTVVVRVARLLGKGGAAPLPRAAEGRPEEPGTHANVPALPLPEILSDRAALRLFGFERPAGTAGKRRAGTAVAPTAAWCAAGPVFDPGTRALRLPRTEDPLRFQWSLVHGVVHAFQDRACTLRAWWAQGAGNDDACFARWAVVEGAAWFAFARYAARYAPELACAAAAGKEGEVPGAWAWRPVPSGNGPPPAVAELLRFPRVEGARFVRRVFERSGWAGVEGLLRNPPPSTDAVLHPSRYPDGGDPVRKVVLADLRPALPPGWIRLRENTLGAFALRTLARHTGDAWCAMVAAEGWDGDRYALYGKEAEGAHLLYGVFLWDEAGAAARGFATLAEGFRFVLGGAGPSTTVKDGWTLRIAAGPAGAFLLELRDRAVVLLRRDAAAGDLDLGALARRARAFSVP